MLKGFLLYVAMNIAPEHEETFNDWYNNHLPHLLKIPGYLWAQRYVGLRGNVKYLALYEIENESYFDVAISEEALEHGPILSKEFAKFQQIPTKTDLIAGVYQQFCGNPSDDSFLRSDRVLSVKTVDVKAGKEEAWARWYEKQHMPSVLKIPGYVKAGGFRLFSHPVLDRGRKLGVQPQFITIHELEDKALVPSLTSAQRVSPAARAAIQEWQAHASPMIASASWNIYSMISKHWKFE